MLHDGEQWVFFLTAVNFELGFLLEIASTCAEERRMLEIFVSTVQFTCSEKGMKDLL